MRLPNAAHTSRPWRIHQLTRDFDVEDVWGLHTPGGADDFPRLLEAIAAGNLSDASPGAARALWAIRLKIGELLGWDDPDTGHDGRAPSLRDRMPADLRDAPPPAFDTAPFTPLYLIDDEFAAEVANRTMHGVVHVGWVPDGTGSHHAQVAILVKPNGLLGRAYLAAIKPFRYLVIYPPVLRHIERQWEARIADTPPGASHPPKA
jgi:hypothetical protein